MNIHQQQSSRWEEQFYRAWNEGDFSIHHNGINPTLIKSFIQSLLTSHSEAIRERVVELPTHYIHKGFEESIPVYKKNDILALLNDSE